MFRQRFKTARSPKIRIQGRTIDINFARLTYLCIHCLAPLKRQDHGLRCTQNDCHYGFLKREEAARLSQEERFMKIGEMFPSEYLRGLDVGKPMILTIAGVIGEKVRNREGSGYEQEYVMRFREIEKKLRLNVTMAKECLLIFNDPDGDTDNWTGRKVTVYRTTVKAFGQEHVVPRIRAPQRGDLDMTKPKAAPKHREPLAPEQLKELLQKKVSKSDYVDKETGELFPVALHSFGEQAPKLVSSKFQAALDKIEDVNAYHLSLAWLTGCESSNELTAAMADALMDWLLNGTKDKKFKAEVSPPARIEAGLVYQEAIKITE